MMDKSSLQDTAAYEDQLGDALEQLLAAGANDLDAIAEGLDALVARSDRQPWTSANLAQELRRLAAQSPVSSDPGISQ
jgi:hypothetical protein